MMTQPVVLHAGPSVGGVTATPAVRDALLAAISVGQPYGCIPGAAIVAAVRPGLNRYKMASILSRASLPTHGLGQQGRAQRVVASELQLQALLQECRQLDGHPTLTDEAHMAVVRALQGEK